MMKILEEIAIEKGYDPGDRDKLREAEEFKRMQRERTTGNNAPVEYDH